MYEVKKDKEERMKYKIKRKKKFDFSLCSNKILICINNFAIYKQYFHNDIHESFFIYLFCQQMLFCALIYFHLISYHCRCLYDYVIES